MNNPCFLTPTLPTPLRTATAPAVCMSMRFPKFGNFKNPFHSSGGFGGGFKFGGGSGGMGGMGSTGGAGKGRDASGGSGSADESNPLLKVWAAYNKVLDKNPITTKACTSLIGFLLGDFIAQKFLGDKDAELDKGRLLRMASFGFLFHGPTGHYFYSALDRMIVGTTLVKVASKVAIDQILWAPVFTAMFFAYLGFAEKKSVHQVKEKIQNDTWTGVKTSWKFWPIAHAINFAFVPTSQRLLYINTLQVGYNVILSMLGNK